MEELNLKSLPEQRNLSDVAYQSIKEYLLSSQLEPGFKLKESLVANKLGISTTPVRLAFRRLELEGIVRVVPRRYIEVLGFSAKDIKEIFDLREYLEALAIKLAIERITPDNLKEIERILNQAEREKEKQQIIGFDNTDNSFHCTIVQLSDNSRLQKAYIPLQSQIQAIRVRMSILSNWPNNALQEHWMIYKALLEKDAPKAEELIRNHIRRVKEDYLKHFKK